MELVHLDPPDAEAVGVPLRPYEQRQDAHGAPVNVQSMEWRLHGSIKGSGSSGVVPTDRHGTVRSADRVRASFW